MKIGTHLWSYIAELSSARKMFQPIFVEKIKTHILCSATFFSRKSYRLLNKVEEYDRGGQATDNIAHAHFTPDS